jgi:isochorismate synthase
MSIQSPLVFRLPGSTQIQTLLLGEGNDVFIIQAFDRQKSAIELRGQLQVIDKASAKTIMDQWHIPELNESNAELPSYTKIVERAIKEIEDGVFDKVVLARQQLLYSETPLSTLFTMLEEQYSEAFVYAFCTDGSAMVGASPETLLNFSQGLLKTEALGGTRTNGQYSDKEFEEHQQIVDYITEGIALCDYQYSVLPRKEKKAGKVEHLCSEIHIHSKGFKKDLALLQVLHPTSAVCGLPFESSLDFIKKNEGFDRGYYAGYLGLISGESEFRFFVNLRCANVFKGVYLLSAGAGINHLSVPEDELKETNNKFQTIAQCLK